MLKRDEKIIQESNSLYLIKPRKKERKKERKSTTIINLLCEYINPGMLFSKIYSVNLCHVLHNKHVKLQILTL